jgi:hypothetical protein
MEGESAPLSAPLRPWAFSGPESAFCGVGNKRASGIVILYHTLLFDREHVTLKLSFLITTMG